MSRAGGRKDDYYDDEDDDESYSRSSRDSRSLSRSPSPHLRGDSSSSKRQQQQEESHDDEASFDAEEHEASVLRHAKFLGMDPVADAGYLWLAEEALLAELPEGWVSGEGEGEYEGLLYYYNEATGSST